MDVAVSTSPYHAGDGMQQATFIGRVIVLI